MVMIRIRFRIRFSVWLVSGYSHVFACILIVCCHICHCTEPVDYARFAAIKEMSFDTFALTHTATISIIVICIQFIFLLLVVSVE